LYFVHIAAVKQTAERDEQNFMDTSTQRM